MGLSFAHKVHKFLRPQDCMPNAVQIYLTWQCNLKCDYCNNLGATGEFNPPDPSPRPTPEQWARALNKMRRDVGISGGEPFVYPGLADLVNGIDRALAIKIYTNMSAPGTLDTIRKFNRPVNFYVSYHPCSGSPDKLIASVLAARATGKFQGAIHAVGASNVVKHLWKVQEKFSAAGLRLHTSVAFEDLDYEGSRGDQRATVRCHKKAINIGPDGRRYNCVTQAIRGTSPLYDIADGQVLADVPNHVCHDYGHCCGCDMLEPGMTVERI